MLLEFGRYVTRAEVGNRCDPGAFSEGRGGVELLSRPAASWARRRIDFPAMPVKGDVCVATAGNQDWVFTRKRGPRMAQSSPKRPASSQSDARQAVFWLSTAPGSETPGPCVFVTPADVPRVGTRRLGRVHATARGVCIAADLHRQVAGLIGLGFRLAQSTWRPTLMAMAAVAMRCRRR